MNEVFDLNYEDVVIFTRCVEQFYKNLNINLSCRHIAAAV
jgi:hypothetical protein